MMPLEFATHSARYWGYYSEPSRCFLVAEIDANHTHTHTHTHTAEIDATHTHTHTAAEIDANHTHTRQK